MTVDGSGRSTPDPDAQDDDQEDGAQQEDKQADDDAPKGVDGGDDSGAQG
jgi:hypothetical protein